MAAPAEDKNNDNMKSLGWKFLHKETFGIGTTCIVTVFVWKKNVNPVWFYLDSAIKIMYDVKTNEVHWSISSCSAHKSSKHQPSRTVMNLSR